jgi:hypothetical protein
MNNRQTLLRNLLEMAKKLNNTDKQPEKQPEAPVAKEETALSSPVRPASPMPQEESPAPLPPKKKMPTLEIAMPKEVRTVEDRLKAEDALQTLREKTAQAAADFAGGQLNRAQFSALYANYNERRVIIERLLERNPDTQAWQHVAQNGQTTFLRQQFEARALSFTIYDVAEHPTLITQQGTPLLDQALAERVAKAIYAAHLGQKRVAAGSKPMVNGKWFVFAPGTLTVTVVLFSLEPSTRQVTHIADLHSDFEKANRYALARSTRIVDQLVFPQRSLFTTPTG